MSCGRDVIPCQGIRLQVPDMRKILSGLTSAAGRGQVM